MRLLLALLLSATVAGSVVPLSQTASAAPVKVPSVPGGYRAGVYASGLNSPTAMTFGPDGRLYVAELNGSIAGVDQNRAGGFRGDIVVIEGTDASGHSTRQSQFSAGPANLGFFAPLGLAFFGNDLYVSSHNRIHAIRGAAGQTRGSEPVEIIPDLHVRGQHQNNAIAFGPDGKLYVGVGGVNNVGVQPHPFNGSILQANPDGSGLRVFASGFRNPYGIAFDPRGLLWATDNGPDPPAVIDPPDKLNIILDGHFYGFPTQFTGGRASFDPPVASFPPHSSADGLTFYNGSLMPELSGDALVACYGPEYPASRDARPRLVRVQLRQNGGRWQATQSILAEGLDRPLAVTVGPDGRIYVADIGAGAIYWIAPAGWKPTPGNPPTAGSQATPTAGVTGTGVVRTRSDPERGTFLTDAAGRTLYQFAQDSPGESTCVNECAATWLPMTVSGALPLTSGGAPGTLGVTTRADGSLQLTYEGMPLYYYVGDTQPSDTNGLGIQDGWSVVNPRPAAAVPEDESGTADEAGEPAAEE